MAETFGVDVKPADVPAWARERAVEQARRYGYTSGIYWDEPVGAYLLGPIEFAGRWRRRYGYVLAAVVYPLAPEASNV